MSKPNSGALKRAAASLDETAPEVAPNPSDVIRPAVEFWRGYVLVPAKGQRTNAWYLAQVELPAEVVERYRVEGRRCRADDPPDQRNVQVAKVMEWLRDPEMVREFLS